MEELKLSYKAEKPAEKNIQIQVGVVSSGDLEVLFQSEAGDTSFSVQITSSSDNSEQRWRNLFNRLVATEKFPAGAMLIHDFSATPGVARLRIEQALEGVRYA